MLNYSVYFNSLAWTDIGAYSCNYQITWGSVNRITDKTYTVEFKGWYTKVHDLM